MNRSPDLSRHLPLIGLALSSTDSILVLASTLADSIQFLSSALVLSSTWFCSVLNSASVSLFLDSVSGSIRKTLVLALPRLGLDSFFLVSVSTRLILIGSHSLKCINLGSALFLRRSWLAQPFSFLFWRPSLAQITSNTHTNKKNQTNKVNCQISKQSKAK